MERRYPKRKNPGNDSCCQCNNKRIKLEVITISSASVKSEKGGEEIIKSYVKGNVIGRKYRVLAKIGEGGFGSVYRARDLRNKQKVAIKIITAEEEVQVSDLREVVILRHLKDKDPRNEYGFVQMLESFQLSDNTFCIVQELMASSVLDFYQSNLFIPFNPQQIRKITCQICHSVKFLHENQLTHCDLKLANILFVNTSYNWRVDKELKRKVKVLKNYDIRICDLGCAIFDDDIHPAWIGTRHYMPPEQILGLGWSHSFDLWSIGCILFELFKAEVLFYHVSNPLEHIACMEEVLGPAPRNMLRESIHHFDEHQLAAYKLEHFIKDEHQPLLKHIEKNNTEEKNQLFDLMGKMLVYDPQERITCQQALDHAFLKQ